MFSEVFSKILHLSIFFIILEMKSSSIFVIILIVLVTIYCIHGREDGLILKEIKTKREARR